MAQERMNVENVNEAINVLIQVAHLAQSRGILTFDDAVKTKSAIDFFGRNQENQSHVINGIAEDKNSDSSGEEHSMDDKGKK